MKKYFLFLLIILGSFSCKKELKGNPDRFKQGVFEIPAGEGYGKTIITRIDSLQIEKFFKKVDITTDKGVVQKEIAQIDTLFIYWSNNFQYRLQIKNPKTDVDKDPIFVQITKVTPTSYDFRARIGYSKFTQEGTVTKIK